MSFNTNYILPGDDKNQIIVKSNYNFSQIISNSTGVPGEIGPIGSTGIIGQVGRDGLSGSTGQKATDWYFQETAPYIDLPYDERPLIYGDIWVDTSPSVNQLIYTYNGSSWVSTGYNFISEGVFTTIQGISGPGEIFEDNAIVIPPSAVNPYIEEFTTFVFSDSAVNVNNANPTYSKVLVSTDASLTASLPIFSFDKTFYQSDGLPSFKWGSTGSDYDIQFSSDDSITIQSQATGTYSSTGGTVSLIGNNVGFNSNTATITGTGGININSPSIGLLGKNVALNNSGGEFKENSGGFSLSATGSVNALTVDVNLTAAQTGTRSALTYDGISNTGALNLSMSGSSLFRVTGGSTYSNIGIGFTGSTGITGGTGASVVKSYQLITDSASSRLTVGTSSNPYILINGATSDVIIVTPTPTTSVYSDGRFNRIWLWVTGNQNPYVESGNVSVIDIYMNSANYSIGGVYVNTNFYFLNDANKIKIIDSAGTSYTGSSPSATGGCRHVRLTFFGSPFNSTSNKQVYLQAFSTGNNTSTVLTYEYKFRPILSVPSPIPTIDRSITYRIDTGGFAPGGL
jgi:hypothetical protein